MSISYEYYKIFYYVAIYESFNRAAKVLLNSQPNIARAINNLESELDTTLFERSHRGVTLTEPGKVLYEYISEAHLQIQAGEEALSKMLGNMQESLSIGFSISITDLTVRNRILPPIREFSISHPKVGLRITNNSTPSLIEGVNNGDYDLAIITTTAHSDSSLREHILYTFNEVPIAGNAYRRELADRPVSIKELVNYPLITLVRGSETFSLHDYIFASSGMILNPYIETYTMRQSLAFVQNDMGITAIAEEYAQPAIDDGSIFAIDLIENMPKREISIIKNTRTRSHAASALLNAIVKHNRD
ncbi:MAG: LysR family transcriptional regulator [Eubacterium sp.]|nr:LysR family transcriptional regulator [Eubacterium sp.]